MIERVRFEEEAHLVAGFEKVAIAAVALVVGAEHRGDTGRLELGQELCHACSQRIACGGRGEVRDDEKAVALPRVQLLAGQPHSRPS